MPDSGKEIVLLPKGGNQSATRTKAATPSSWDCLGATGFQVVSSVTTSIGLVSGNLLESASLSALGGCDWKRVSMVLFVDRLCTGFLRLIREIKLPCRKFQECRRVFCQFHLCQRRTYSSHKALLLLSIGLISNQLLRFSDLFSPSDPQSRLCRGRV